MVALPEKQPSLSYSVSGTSAGGSRCQCTRSVDVMCPQYGAPQTAGSTGFHCTFKGYRCKILTCRSELSIHTCMWKCMLALCWQQAKYQGCRAHACMAQNRRKAHLVEDVVSAIPLKHAVGIVDPSLRAGDVEGRLQRRRLLC